MIARLWQGTVPTAKADAYLAFLQERALPDYRGIPGNISAYILRREEGEITHFSTLTYWVSLAAIAAFAGADIERAKYYPEDQDFLLEFAATVEHSEVFS